MSENYNCVTFVRGELSCWESTAQKSKSLKMVSSRRLCYKNSVIFKFDYDQISRVCFNLIKNSVESLKEKGEKTSDFIKNIDIEITEHIDYISLKIIDSGIGFKNIKTSDLTKPYFTTKTDGTGLGLSIVSKIINDHNGMITFTNLKNGAKVEIKFYK